MKGRVCLLLLILLVLQSSSGDVIYQDSQEWGIQAWIGHDTDDIFPDQYQRIYLEEPETIDLHVIASGGSNIKGAVYLLTESQLVEITSDILDHNNSLIVDIPRLPYQISVLLIHEDQIEIDTIIFDSVDVIREFDTYTIPTTIGRGLDREEYAFTMYRDEFHEGLLLELTRNETFTHVITSVGIYSADLFEGDRIRTYQHTVYLEGYNVISVLNIEENGIIEFNPNALVNSSYYDYEIQHHNENLYLTTRTTNYWETVTEDTPIFLLPVLLALLWRRRR